MKIRLLIGFAMIALIAASCGAAPQTIGGTGEAGASAVADRATAPQQAPEQPSADSDPQWATVHTDYAVVTFEDAMRANPTQFVGKLIAIGTPTWNTDSGILGKRDDWKGNQATPRRWVPLSFTVSTVVADGNWNIGETVTVAYPDSGSHLPFSSAELGATMLVGADIYPMRFQDGSTRDLLWVDPQAVYIAPAPDGPAYRLWSVATAINWKTARNESMVADGRTATVAMDIASLVDRLRNPVARAEDELGYDDIYRPNTDSPASVIVP
jgi:hypothetical protein